VSGATALTFQLAVTDALGLADPTPATVTITVFNVNQAPIANAGADQSVNETTAVTLNGSSSSDPDGNLPLSYSWTQTLGPAVSWLTSRFIAQPQFNPPNVGSSTALDFQLAVTDALGLADPTPDTVRITITPAAPLAPSNAVATARNLGFPGTIRRIDVTWWDNSDDEDNFHILRYRKRDGLEAAAWDVGANFTSTLDSGLSAATTYEYAVDARNTAGDSANAFDTATTPPVITLVSALSRTSIQVAWQFPDALEGNLRFHLRRYDMTDVGVPLEREWTTISPSASSVTDDTAATIDLQCGHTYLYQLRFESQWGWSEWYERSGSTSGC
jgi:hypothetical protein